MTSARHRTSWISKLVALFIAVYLFNFSIDSRDRHPDYIAEDLAFNDIESIFEFSLECILGFENAVAEHDERDHEDGGSFEFNKIFYCLSINSVQVSPPNFIKLTYSSKVLKESLLTCSLDVNSPPPWC